MDSDNSGTIDRMEWVAYLASPPASIYQLGNMNYFDFELRDMFEDGDKDKDGFLSSQEFCNIIKLDEQYEVSKQLNDANKKKADPLFQGLMKDGLRELKQLANDNPNQYVQPNLDPTTLNWVEFRRYRKILKIQKAEVQAQLVLIHHDQKKEEFNRQMTSQAMQALAGADIKSSFASEETKQSVRHTEFDDIQEDDELHEDSYYIELLSPE